MPHGWIILDKPVGLGSTQAVAAVKRNLREAGYGKKVKVGHGGTLDPLAEGVLPIALGEATKLCGRMLDASKIYAFTIQFGSETDTLDAEGEVIARSEHFPSFPAIAAVLAHFTGPIEQVPPAYSALKVDGQRAYDLARAGEDVELKSRAVTIHALDFDDPHYTRKAQDLQERQNRVYDQIASIEVSIAEVQTRMDNIRQHRISTDNVYQFLLYFDKLYDQFTDLEKKTFMNSFIERVEIYPERRSDGRIVKRIEFRFPVYFNGSKITGLGWDEMDMSETVCLLSNFKARTISRLK